MSTRVVITGLGVVAPIGIGKTEFWENLLAGKSGVCEVEAFDTSSYTVHRGAEVKHFVPEDYVQAIDIKQMGRCSQLAVAATRLALHDAGLEPSQMDAERVGVVLGTTMGEPQVLSEIDRQWVDGGIPAVQAALVSRYPSHVIASNIAIEFNFRGPNMMIPTACAAGNYAIGYAYDLLRQGRSDVMVAGGADCFGQMAFTGFARLAAMAPERCQPFDKNRKGIIVGEGAGILVMEPLECALERGTLIYGEVLGYGLGCDAFHMTAAHPEGAGMIRAMEKACCNSGILPSAIDYISAHGTGTPTNDRLETFAIKQLFGEAAYRIPVSSIKSMIGHTMGAASAIEAIACCLSLQHQRIPPTINYDEADPECDLDYVPNEARDADVRLALNSAAAFGGNNAALVLSRLS